MNQAKFYMGGLLILAAVVYLIVSSTQANAQYFLTVDELKSLYDEAYATPPFDNITSNSCP